MTTINLRIVWSAKPAAAPVSSAKEPPQRRSEPVSAFITAATQRPFVYDWEERLEAVNPVTHPKMRFDQYSQYKDKLFSAVTILNATPDIENGHAAECVLAAFWRLREARRNQNVLNRETNMGRTDFQMDGEDMEALMELAMATPKDSALRVRLEHDWMRGTMKRDQDCRGRPDTDHNLWQLRTDLARGFHRSIPGSDAASLYKDAVLTLEDKDRRAARIAQSGLMLVASNP